MKLDIEYLKGMLAVFVDSDRPFITLADLATAGYPVDQDETVFHYFLLIEGGYVSNMKLELGNPEKLGIFISPQTGKASWSGTKIRLTKGGLEFAESLNNKTVFDQLKQFSDQPMSVLKDVGLELLKSYMKSRLGLS